MPTATKNRSAPPRGSDFEFDDDKTALPRVDGPESACIYFGPGRLAELKCKAKAAGMNLSAFVSTAIDVGQGLGRERLEKLEALARLRNVTPIDLLAGLVDSAVSGAGF